MARVLYARGVRVDLRVVLGLAGASAAAGAGVLAALGAGVLAAAGVFAGVLAAVRVAGLGVGAAWWENRGACCWWVVP